MKTRIFFYAILCSFALMIIGIEIQAKEPAKGIRDRREDQKRHLLKKPPFSLMDKHHKLGYQGDTTMPVPLRKRFIEADKPNRYSKQDIRLEQSESALRGGKKEDITVGKNLQKELVNKGVASLAADLITEAWVRHYDSRLIPSEDRASALAVDAEGNVYVTGYSEKNNWSIYTTIKYEQSNVFAGKSPKAIPSKYLLSQNYPNPFNPVTTIRYE